MVVKVVFSVRGSGSSGCSNVSARVSGSMVVVVILLVVVRILVTVLQLW